MRPSRGGSLGVGGEQGVQGLRSEIQTEGHQPTGGSSARVGLKPLRTLFPEKCP